MTKKNKILFSLLLLISISANAKKLPSVNIDGKDYNLVTVDDRNGKKYRTDVGYCALLNKEFSWSSSDYWIDTKGPFVTLNKDGSVNEFIDVPNAYDTLAIIDEIHCR